MNYVAHLIYLLDSVNNKLSFNHVFIIIIIILKVKKYILYFTEFKIQNYK